MSGPELVQPLEPWQTVWPAGVALAVCVVAAVRSRRSWWPARTDLLWMAVLFMASLVVRIWVVPAWWRYYPDGHDAEYWDIFRGVRPVNRGGTVLYPAMQWMWWALGCVLPHRTGTIIASMSAVGAAGVVVWWAAVRKWVGPVAGAVAAGLVMLHPVHAAWSSSAYNVVVPWTLSAVVLWCAAHLGRERHIDPAVAWLGAAVFVLAVSTRMDSAMIAVPAGLLALGASPEGLPWARALRRRVGPSVIGALVFALVLAGLAAWPLVFPGEVPGAGERATSFAINRAWFAPHAPWDTRVGVGMVLVAGLLATARQPVFGVVWLASGVGVHLLMASFDDYGGRHALWALFAWTALIGASTQAADRAPLAWSGRAVAAVAAIAVLVGLGDMRDRFYGSEEAFADLLAQSEPWVDLPRLSVSEARIDSSGQPCGWVNEDPRVSPMPQKSHFNLIQPDEASSMRGPGGCLRWCADVQDWRWSSRGVRDRALRTTHLYALRPVAVVTDSASGYACLVLELGQRQRCRVAGASDAQGDEAEQERVHGALP